MENHKMYGLRGGGTFDQILSLVKLDDIVNENSNFSDFISLLPVILLSKNKLITEIGQKIGNPLFVLQREILNLEFVEL